jgi:hypothetical protein
MRNYPFLGSAPISADLPVSREAVAAADPNFSHVQRYALRLVGELPAVSKGLPLESRTCWGEQN